MNLEAVADKAMSEAADCFDWKQSICTNLIRTIAVVTIVAVIFWQPPVIWVWPIVFGFLVLLDRALHGYVPASETEWP